MTVIASPLDGTGAYVHWGVIQISVANLTVILLMIVVLALAILLPFPHGRQQPQEQAHQEPARSHDEQ